ncbi:MAG: cache domain-containing protein, partial [Desulfocapsa sp.]|nr:cache domain-containing protein [Desulfocapsa sp.]
MSLLATLSDIVKGCPRNIRRRLLRDILLIVFVTSGAILSIVFFQGIKTQHDFSNAIIDKANIRVSSHFQSFTDPLGHILKLLGKWGESGLLNVNDPNLIATQFQALMEILPTIHSISIADTNENNIQLSHNNDAWLLEDSHGEKATLSEWIKGEAKNKTILDEKHYSMSTTNWFRGAVTLPSDTAFFLTEPYLQKTTGETVITASLYWTKRNDPNGGHVSAVSFTIESLMEFIEELRITPNSSIFLFEKDGTLLSDIHKDSITPESILAKISSTLRTDSAMNSKTISIKDRGNSWWVGISP